MRRIEGRAKLMEDKFWSDAGARKMDESYPKGEDEKKGPSVGSTRATHNFILIREH
jgi:hypothetical protein